MTDWKAEAEGVKDINIYIIQNSKDFVFLTVL